jgi:hypothetical protein
MRISFPVFSHRLSAAALMVMLGGKMQLVRAPTRLSEYAANFSLTFGHLTAHLSGFGLA